jgi:ABC-2 type transport system permease protein
VVRQFARLKLRLVRNGFRSPQYAVLFTIGAIGSGIAAVLGFGLLAGLRGDRIAADATLVTFAAITLIWTVVPLLGFGTDETLDPQRLALLPLRRIDLLRGLLVAALVGVSPVATTFALSGALVGLSHDAPSALLIIAGITATLLFCVVASRTLIALLAPLLRSRRGRDLILMGFVLAAVVPQSFRLFHTNGSSSAFRHSVAEVASRVRYTPFGLGGDVVAEAGRGHFRTAILVLGALLGIIGVLLCVWARAIPRAMTATDLAAPERNHGGERHERTLYPRAVPLPRTHAGAVAAKELRYYLRDPRRRGPLFAALVVPTIFLFSTLRDAPAQTGAATLLALVALLPASGLTLNQFGLDGAALWSTVVAVDDPSRELLGKNIATAVLVVPLVTAPALLAALATGGWSYVPLTIGLAPGLLGVILAVGNVVSVWVPYALPDRRNPLAANPGQGCIGGIGAMGAIAFDFVVLIPVGLATAIALATLPLAAATLVSVLIAAAYGLGAWVLGLRLATRHSRWRMPELLDAVSPRHAG